MSISSVLIGFLCSVIAAALGYAVGLRRSSTVDLDRLTHAVRDVAAQATAQQSQQLVELASGRFELLENSAAQRWQASGAELTGHLDRLAAHLARIDTERTREAASLSAAVADLRRSSEQVRDEARTLAGALNDGSARGAWGEMQLRRVLENAGMVRHADFAEQIRSESPDGQRRPDVTVRLPNDRAVVIDAKAPLDAYLRAGAAATDQERHSELARHAAALARHVQELSKRRYDAVVDGSVDFVVLFVPGESFLSAALEHSPDLLEQAARQNVMLASPVSLLAFLRGVASGWRERHVADEAQAIAELGRELHERTAVFVEHFDSLGSSLGRTVTNYNAASASLQRRLLVTARRFEELGAGSRRDLGDPLLLSETPWSVSGDRSPTTL